MNAAHVHPTAVVDEGAMLQSGVRVWHFCHVMPGAFIGRDSVLGQNVFVAGDVRIGERCHLQNNVSVFFGVTLEDDVFCGPSVVFTNDRNPRAFEDKRSEWEPTLIRRGATLGANSTIVCGHVVGEYAMVAAGCVVTRDVPPHALFAGVPGRLSGWVCTCGGRLIVRGQGLRCPRCGRAYGRQGDGILEA